MSNETAQLGKAERRRLQTLERRKQTAAEVVDPSAVAVGPAQSFAARTLTQALPRELLDRGLISFDQHGRPVVAAYDPSLLAPNPQLTLWATAMTPATLAENVETPDGVRFTDAEA